MARKPGFLDDPNDNRQIPVTQGGEFIISLMPEALITGRVVISEAAAAAGVAISQ